MKNENTKLTRRKFMKDTAITAAGIAAGLGVTREAQAGNRYPYEKLNKDHEADIKKTRSYNQNMEYRCLGKTGLWVSAVCLGGHWKRIDKVVKTTGSINPYVGPEKEADLEPFHKNRHDVVSRCMEVGINLIDFAGDGEPDVYGKALKGRRDKMYIAYSQAESEMRNPNNRTAKKLLEVLETGLKSSGVEYADIWRIMALERGGRHTQAEVEEMIKALETAKKQGKCRFTGLSTHDRKWAKMLIETYPEAIQVLVTPYTANSKILPKGSLFDAVKKYDVGILGIKPFGSNSLFKGDSSPESPYREEDDLRARMAIRYIISNPAVTAPIPGLISIQQVDNMAKAVQERRELDRTEKAELEKATKEMWAQLPEDYQWLKEWEYV